jgi:hypothetical protein
MANTKPQVTVYALESKSISNRIKWFGTHEEYNKIENQSTSVCGGRAGTNFTTHKLRRLYK